MIAPDRSSAPRSVVKPNSAKAGVLLAHALVSGLAQSTLRPISDSQRLLPSLRPHKPGSHRSNIISDKVKTQAYCDLAKLEDQVEAAAEKNDTKTLEALSNQAEALVDKLPEYYKLMDGLEQVDPKSSEVKEFMSILSALDKRCPK